MKILADENIPYVRDAFGPLGDVITMSGRQISRDAVRDVDLLLVRSITKVGEDLLTGSRVRFVATATIGEDHIDKPWLAQNGIAFASAPGSNAGSVTQYIAAALLALSESYNLDLARMTLGIVGVGNVGSRVNVAAMALGMKTVLNDPPLARATGEVIYRPLEEIFACDVVTLHVPLIRQGEDKTYHLADETFINRLRPGAILINSSRGSVADGAAIKNALDSGRLKACVLDVWENEPDIDVSLLDRVFIGTPHIAGYSFDGKVNGTRMIYDAACRFLGCEPSWDPSPLLPEPEHPHVDVDSTAARPVHAAVREVYDIRQDDTAMRGLADQPEDARGVFFDQLRKKYPRRREFFNTLATMRPSNAELEASLAGLGFKIEG